MTFPPSSGPPQAGGFPPPYGQQYQNNPYMSGYGPGGGPPKKSRQGLWIGLIIGAIAAISLGVTGFITPGFFLSDEESASTNNNQGPGQVIASGDPSPEQQFPIDPAVEKVIRDMVAKINAGDVAEASNLLCKEPDGRPPETFVDDIQELVAAKVQLQVDEMYSNSPGSVVGVASGPANTGQYHATFGAGVLSTGPCVAAALADPF